MDSIDINSLSSKIKKEVDILEVGFCVSDIAMASEEVAMKLANTVSARINKEEDIAMSASCVSNIAEASQEVSNQIINRLNPKLREELEKRIHF